MRIAKSVAELIGRTPMLELTHFEQTHCLNAHLLAKVESFNPGGSVKDRIALGMVEAAEKAGKLDFCPNVPRRKQLDAVMNNSFAFGGNNASIIFGRQAGEPRRRPDAPC